MSTTSVNRTRSETAIGTRPEYKPSFGNSILRNSKGILFESEGAILTKAIKQSPNTEITIVTSNDEAVRSRSRFFSKKMIASASPSNCGSLSSLGNSQETLSDSEENILIATLGRLSDETRPRASDWSHLRLGGGRGNCGGGKLAHRPIATCSQEPDGHLKHAGFQSLTTPETKRQNYHCFLKDSGLLGAISTVVLDLYKAGLEDQLPPPEKASEHIAGLLGYSAVTQDEIETAKHYNLYLTKAIKRLETENDLLRRIIDNSRCTETEVDRADPELFDGFRFKHGAPVVSYQASSLDMPTVVSSLIEQNGEDRHRGFGVGAKKKLKKNDLVNKRPHRPKPFMRRPATRTFKTISQFFAYLAKYRRDEFQLLLEQQQQH